MESFEEVKLHGKRKQTKTELINPQEMVPRTSFQIMSRQGEGCVCVKKCVAAENLVTKRVIASFEMCALVPIKLDLIISNPENCIFQVSFKL